MSVGGLLAMRCGAALLGCCAVLVPAAVAQPQSQSQSPSHASAVALAQAQPQAQPARSAIHVSVPARVQRGIVYDLTIAGFSRRRATAYLFVDYQPCAPAFPTEQGRAAGESDVYRVRGTFAFTSGWKSPVSGADHACAYLVSPDSGALLTSAVQTYQVR